MSWTEYDLRTDFLNAAASEKQIEEFVTWLVDAKDIDTLRSELSEYYLDRYIELSKSQEGIETLANIMEAEEFSPE